MPNPSPHAAQETEQVIALWWLLFAWRVAWVLLWSPIVIFCMALDGAFSGITEILLHVRWAWRDR